MLALGNDIVDLQEKPRNGKRYYRRLLNYSLNLSEQICIQGLLGIKENFLASLVWAIKESAYKSSNKLGNYERFNPKMFRISSLLIEGEQICGEVYFEKTKLIIQGKINESFIHIWTTSSKECIKVTEAISKIDSETQSRKVRQLAIDSSGFEDALISKDPNNIPWMLLANMDKIEVSLSHHGRYVACAHQI